MRLVITLVAGALAGCNWVLGLDAPSAGDAAAIDAEDGVPGDAVDAPDPSDAVDAPPTAAPTSIAAGTSHTCVVRDGQLWCWGQNSTGQLGYGHTADIGDNEAPLVAGPVQVGGGAIPIAVTAGTRHTCALLESGAVKCWGDATSGRLGYANINIIGDNETPELIAPVAVGDTSTMVAAGDHHTCAVGQSAGLRCWGRALEGQLGYGNGNDLGDNETPASVGAVATGGVVFAVATGAQHTCVLLNTGAIQCWGLGLDGRLGYGNTNTIGDNETPAGTVNVGGAAVQVVAGGAHTCARLTNGGVVCWGDGLQGALGYGNVADIGDGEEPLAAGLVPIGGAVTQLAAGAAHTCALLDTGAVRCWGRNSKGQLGYGNNFTIGDDEPPMNAGDVSIGGLAIAIAAGGDHTCAILAGGAVRCWGNGAAGQLGYGATGDVGDNETPASVPPVEF